MIEIHQLVVGLLRTNCYIAGSSESAGAVIIDPGAEPETIRSALLRLKKKPEAILLTHGHFDHTGAAEALRAFYTVPIYAYKEEEALLKDGRQNLGYMIKGHTPLCPDRLLRDGEMVEMAGLCLKVLYTPGHTKGSCCFYCESDRVLFSGDTLFCQSYGRTDFPSGSSRDMIDSITKKLFLLPDATRVLPGHGEETQIGFEKQHNPCACYKD